MGATGGNLCRTANADLLTAKNAVTSITTELATAKTDLATATADAAIWKAKAIKYGALPAETTPAAIPGAEAEGNDEALTALDNLPHNIKADKYFG